MKERIDFARQHGDQDVGAAVVVVILKHDAHARERLAIGGERRAHFERAFAKRAVAIVAKQMALSQAGDENIVVAVVEVIADGHAHSVHLNI